MWCEPRVERQTRAFERAVNRFASGLLPAAASFDVLLHFVRRDHPVVLEMERPTVHVGAKDDAGIADAAPRHRDRRVG
jgi:hypothetical protein